MTMRYSDRFLEKAAAAAYESEEYGAGSYASCIWERQRPVLQKIMADFQQNRREPLRLLDFACGTGRVLASLEHLADIADGVDISEHMVALARGKCTKARLLVGDILNQPELLPGTYDVITCFRFILNVEPELRARVLRCLREKLSSPAGRLLVNIHGNSHSLRHAAIVWRRGQPEKPDTMLNEMSPGAAKKLLWENGFEITRQLGFGLLPPTLYRTPLRGLASAGDRWLAGENFLKNFAVDMLFVCRPR